MDKTVIYFIVFGLFWLVVLFTGCATSRLGRDVLEHQRAIDAVEAERAVRDRAVADAIRELDAITRRSKAMGSTIDELIELFNEYDNRVRTLIKAYNSATAYTDTIDNL